jgi:hypothetical protein
MHGTIAAKTNAASATGSSVASCRNGAGAAAVLAAGIGSLAVGLIATLADKFVTIKSAMIFSKPTGPLSGVTTSAIVVWLIAWVLLHARWRGKTVDMGRIGAAALILLALGLLLTFPPFANLL